MLARVCRTDLHVIEGELAQRKSPITPGHQVVGVIEAVGERAKQHEIGTRVGIAWLHSTDGTCEYCRAAKENLCNNPAFTGWTVDGGYAEYALAEESFVYPIPEGFDDLKAAPLLCAGIIGFRALRLSGIERGGRLGLYGFGAAAHVAIQVARHWGAEVYAATRDERHQKLALELGAVWAGGTVAEPPEKLDSAIIFAPAGEIVPAALKALKKGGTLALGGIHMSTIPPLDYDLLYEERVVRSVANNTRAGRAGFPEGGRRDSGSYLDSGFPAGRSEPGAQCAEERRHSRRGGFEGPLICLHGRTFWPVELAIDFGVAQHALHIGARFIERNAFDELGGLAIIPRRHPGGDVRFACVIGRQRRFPFPLQLVGKLLSGNTCPTSDSCPA